MQETAFILSRKNKSKLQSLETCFFRLGISIFKIWSFYVYIEKK